MPLTWFIVFVLVVAAATYYFPPQGQGSTIKNVIVGVLVILLIVGMLQFFGVLRGGPRIITGLR